MSEQKLRYIEIEEPRIIKNRCIKSRISFSNDIKKFFRSRVFSMQYDVDIQNVNSSILQIPVVSNIIPIAWAVNADVYVRELDKSYLESLNQMKKLINRWYPHFSFPINIHVEKVIKNRFSNIRYGLLFSGGVDSTTSYIKYKSKKPNLIMLLGADIPCDEREFWMKVQK